jgi:hypothetical protein
MLPAFPLPAVHPMLPRSRRHFRVDMQDLRRRAARPCVNRLIDWDLMRAFDYHGPCDIEGEQPAFFVMKTTKGNVGESALSFLQWAAGTGPMIWRHITGCCDRAGYRVHVNREGLVGAVLRAGTLSVRDRYHAPSLFSNRMRISTTRELLDMLTLLLDQGARIPSADAPESSRKELTALARLDIEVWRFLEKRGLDWSAIDDPGRFVGMLVLGATHAPSVLEKLAHLQSRGFDLARPCRLGLSPLLLLLSQPNTPFLRPVVRFLECPLFPDIQSRGWGMLLGEMDLAYQPRYQPRILARVAFLKRNGLSPNHPDKEGRHPLHGPAKAVFRDFPPWVVDLFLKAGGDPFLPDAAGQTVLDVARVYNVALADHLERAMALRQRTRALGERKILESILPDSLGMAQGPSCLRSEVVRVHQKGRL